MKSLGVVAVLFCFIIVIQGHGYLLFPTARTGTANDERTAPCGTATSGSVLAGNYYVQGRTSPLKWVINADHGGTVQINYQGPGATTFTNISANVPNNNPPNLMVTFNDTCDKCTVQWLWQSTEPTPYFGCADISVLPATTTVILTLADDFTTFTANKAANLAKLVTSLAILGKVNASQIIILDVRSGSTIIDFTIDYDYNNIATSQPNDQIATLVGNLDDETQRTAANFPFTFTSTDTSSGGSMGGGSSSGGLSPGAKFGIAFAVILFVFIVVVLVFAVIAFYFLYLKDNGGVSKLTRPGEIVSDFKGKMSGSPA